MNKYRVSPPEQRRFRGKTYASKAEMEYAVILYAMIDANEIRLVIEQPRVQLGVPENVYVPDFFVLDSDGGRFVDVKGMETAAFRRNKKLWKSYGRAPLHIVKKSGAKFKTVEVV